LSAAYRIIDVSLNRAGEGLRTLEDYARFVLDDASLSRLAKQLRHDLAAAAGELPSAERLAARDTPGDVGTTLTTSSEQVRTDPAAVAMAAAVRCQQALRSAEEYVKCVQPAVAERLEAIRYQTYSLASAIETLPRRCRRLAESQLYVLIDADKSLEALASHIRLLADAGVDLLQLRDKSLDDRTLFERARVAVQTVRSCPANNRPLLIINDRPDIAIAAQADGVHVGQEELPYSVVRRLVGSERLIGVSTHSLPQAERAQLEGADYIGCGPTFASHTKSFASFPGLAFLQQVAHSVTLPAFAIGGIGAGNLDEVLATGMRRIAVTAAVSQASAPASAASELKRRLQASRTK